MGYIDQLARPIILLDVEVNGRNLRSAQLQQIVKSRPDVILGDVNFHSEAENEVIPREFVDGGLLLGLVTPTFDSNVNLMHQHMWPGWDVEPMRLDRILVREETCLVSSMSICFDEPIRSSSFFPPPAWLFPSDHFGLVGEISPKVA